MTDEQLANLWAFARGDTPGLDFEKWFVAQDDLEGPLGESLHWSLASSSYADRDEVWTLRQSLAQALEPGKQCECASIRDLDAIRWAAMASMNGSLPRLRMSATTEAIFGGSTCRSVACAARTGWSLRRSGSSMTISFGD